MKRQQFLWLGACGLAAASLLTGCQSAVPMAAVRDTSPTLTASQTADLQLAYGRSLEKGGNLDEAMTLYKEALAKHPRRAEFADRLAVVHDKKGQFDLAMPLHKRAVASQPSNADFVCNLGYSYYLQKHYPQAEAHFRKAIQLAPEHKRAYNNLGLVLACGGRSQDALVAFQRAGCSESEAHSNLAFTLAMNNSLKEAQTHFALAKQLDPGSRIADKGLRTVSAQVERPEALSQAQLAPPPVPRSQPQQHAQPRAQPIRQATPTEHLPEHHIQAATLVQLPATAPIVDVPIPDSAALTPTPPVASAAQPPVQVSPPSPRPEFTLVPAPQPVSRPAPQPQVLQNNGRELSEISPEDLRDIQLPEISNHSPFVRPQTLPEAVNSPAPNPIPPTAVEAEWESEPRSSLPRP